MGAHRLYNPKQHGNPCKSCHTCTQVVAYRAINDELMQLAAFKDNFVAALGHEMRTVQCIMRVMPLALAPILHLSCTYPAPIQMQCNMLRPLFCCEHPCRPVRPPQPLNGVFGMLQVAMKCNDREELYRYVDKALHGCELLAGIHRRPVNKDDTRSAHHS